MQELVKKLDDFASKLPLDNPPEQYLRKAAARWGAFVLEFNTGAALKSGLDIAKAMVLYADAIE